MRKLFGKEHKQAVNWLHSEWWKNGPPICLVRGFSGVGKTEVKNQYLDKHRTAGNRVCDFVVPESLGSQLTEFWLQLGQELSDIGDQSLADEVASGVSGSRLTSVLANTISKPTLLVLDEFQRVLDQHNAPVREFGRLLETLTRLPTFVYWR